MTVYVDDAAIRATVPNGARSVTGVWSHMMADTVAELDEMARRIGMRREWRQDKRSGVHYDVVTAKRLSAVRLGAVQLSAGSEQWRSVVSVAKEQYWQVCPRSVWVQARRDWRDVNYSSLFGHDEMVARAAEAECRRIFGIRPALDN